MKIRRATEDKFITRKASPGHMTELITLLSTGKGTWAEVASLIKSQPWEKVLIITDEFGSKFTGENVELIVLNLSKDTYALRDDIKNTLKDKINGLEVAVNISSGSGKEHMALLAALISTGVGFRLVTLSRNRMQEL